jgi:hypothetical protein
MAKDTGKQAEAEAEAPVEWTPIAVTARKLIGPSNGVFTIRLTLSAWPDQDWQRLFAGPPSVGSHPTVQNRSIIWEVLKSELTEAYETIKTSIDRANAEYVQVLVQREQIRQQSEGKQAAAQAELDAVQKELDAFKF